VAGIKSEIKSAFLLAVREEIMTFKNVGRLIISWVAILGRSRGKLTSSREQVNLIFLKPSNDPFHPGLQFSRPGLPGHRCELERASAAVSRKILTHLGFGYENNSYLFDD
jgi:hypothetical protein